MFLLRRRQKEKGDSGPHQASHQAYAESRIPHANPLALPAKTSVFHSKPWVAAMILATGLAGDFEEIVEEQIHEPGIPENWGDSATAP